MWSGFDPAEVTVAGNHRVSSGEILRRADIARDRSMWLENTGAIADRIRAIPDIASVSIHRLPPASLTISVSERVPFAVLQSGEQLAVVDHALRVLSSSGEGATLPVLVLPRDRPLTPGTFVTVHDALVLRDAFATMASNGLSPATLAFDRYGELVATMSGDLRVLLGEPNDLERKIRLVNAIRAQVVRRQQSVSAIDVRAPATPVVVYR